MVAISREVLNIDDHGGTSVHLWFGIKVPGLRPGELTPESSLSLLPNLDLPGFLDSAWHSINSGPITPAAVGQMAQWYLASHAISSISFLFTLACRESRTG